jgi:hypothetical protein
LGFLRLTVVKFKTTAKPLLSYSGRRTSIAKRCTPFASKENVPKEKQPEQDSTPNIQLEILKFTTST